MKKHTERLHIMSVEQLSYSAKGNPRWKFVGITDDGRRLTFKTASTASSVYDCNPNCLQFADVVLIAYHQTASGALVADSWETTGIERPRAVACVQLTNLVCVGTKPIKPAGDHHG